RDDADEGVDPTDVALHTRFPGLGGDKSPAPVGPPAGRGTPRLLIASPARPDVMTAIRVLSYNVRYANRGDHHDA
ncbi:hypothetical protein EXE43_28810, partial [Halorubrum sp. SS5]